MRFEMIFVAGRAEVKQWGRTARERAQNPSRDFECVPNDPIRLKVPCCFPRGNGTFIQRQRRYFRYTYPYEGILGKPDGRSSTGFKRKNSHEE